EWALSLLFRWRSFSHSRSSPCRLPNSWGWAPSCSWLLLPGSRSAASSFSSVFAGNFPSLSVVLLLAFLFSFWNDNHVIRQVPARAVKRPDLLHAFQTWYDSVEK